MMEKRRTRQIRRGVMIAFLLLFSFRHIYIGLDLWDTGYNYANFAYMGTEHMDSMWMFSTYLSNVIGHFFTLLPGGDTLLGMNAYTALFAFCPALLGFLFCTKVLKLKDWMVFVGELAALCMCWCPTALLYNYVTFTLLCAGCICLYLGLDRGKAGWLVAAGICLGTNVFVRFPNLVQAALILVVWLDDFISYCRKKKTGEARFWRPVLCHTGWCLLGYLIPVAVMALVFMTGYGPGQYTQAILRLFAMTDDASDYTPKAMIMGIIGTYVEHLYWVVRIAFFLAAAYVVNLFFSRLEEKNSQGRVAVFCQWMRRIMVMVILLLMVVWLYVKRFCSFEFYTYGAMFRPGVLFLMLVLLLSSINILRPGAECSLKRYSVILFLVVFLTSIGSNNEVYPSLNNLFLMVPYVLWQVDCLLRKRIKALYPIQCLTAIFLLICAVQFAGFGMIFVFAEGTGVQKTTARVENNSVLNGIMMSEEKAEWITELTDYVEKENLLGQESITYGMIPALSYYLEMPAAFNPWSDLKSYSIQVMEEQLGNMGSEPVIICDVTVAYQDTDPKWKLLEAYMLEHNYAEAFRNEKFLVYRPQK